MGRRDRGFHTPFANPLAVLGKVKTVRKGVAKATPASAPPPARERIDDAELFRREVAGTKPLAAPATRVTTARNEAAPRRRRVTDDAEVLASLADLVAGEGAFDVSDT